MLIYGFFSAVDDLADEAGNTLADKMFTPDGVMVAAAGTTTGSAGMSNPLMVHIATKTSACRDLRVPQKCMECSEETQALCQKSVHS